MKTAIVTGAARGIGLAIAERLLAGNFNVAMLDIDEENLLKSAKGLGNQGTLLALQCDISNRQQVMSVMDEVANKFGSINALVNNAGIATFKPFMRTTADDWNDILATNLSGAFHCSQACVPHLIEAGGGSIVNITSISAGRASTLRVAYGTSKAALAQLSKQMSVELGNEGIRVNAVAPGPIDTDMAKKVHSAEIRADYHDNIPLNRYGSVEEIANVVHFLCGDESTYVNGQEIAVDGGFCASGIGLPTLRSESDT
jgi:NAD(P)-dependent dehydrogenase (short-subunit alcohol dehydrogenase family)